MSDGASDGDKPQTVVTGKYADFVEMVRALRDLGATEVSTTSEGGCSAKFAPAQKILEAKFPLRPPLLSEREDRDRDRDREPRQPTPEERANQRDYAANLLAGTGLNGGAHG